MAARQTIEQEVDVRRELDSLVTQMHSSGIRNTLSRAMAEMELDLAEVRATLKRPPRSERPVLSAVRSLYRQG